MENKKKIAPTYKHGYETYCKLRGSALLKLTDSTDVVTDREDNSVPIPCVNHKEPIYFVPRGRSNNMMYEIMKKIGTNVTVGSNIEHKMKIILGDGIQVVRRTRNANGDIEVKEVEPSEEPEIFRFLADNDFDQIRMELANDLVIFYDAYVEYIFNREDKPKLVQIKTKETTCSRISKIDEKTGKSEWHGYSAEWHKGTPTDVIATPLLDRQRSLYDLKVRMGMIPNEDGINQAKSQKRFVHNIRINTPGRFYYSKPYWWSVFASGWYDFSSSIPILKRSLIKNQMSIRYMVYIKDTFWNKLYKSRNLTEDDAKAAAREEFLKNMEDFLAGEENAGKAFVSEFCYDKIKGFEEKDIIINALESPKGGEYIEDSEEVSNTICYAMGVHPSIIGASPGKSKTISGTEARELYIMEQAMMKRFQDLTIAPLYVAKVMNEWPEDIYFSVVNCQLTTLDKGTGAVKNIGIKPEGEQ